MSWPLCWIKEKKMKDAIRVLARTRDDCQIHLYFSGVLFTNRCFERVGALACSHLRDVEQGVFEGCLWSTSLKNKSGFLECVWPSAPTRLEMCRSRPVVVMEAMSHTFVAAGAPNLQQKGSATRCDFHCCGRPLYIKGATTQRQFFF